MGRVGKNGAEGEKEFTDAHNTLTQPLRSANTVSRTHSQAMCFHAITGGLIAVSLTRAFSFPPAYQLRICQPPAPVVNANILADNEEFEIGLSRCCFVVFLCPDQRYDGGIEHSIYGMQFNFRSWFV